jgi:hypothetical protein
MVLAGVVEVEEVLARATLIIYYDVKTGLQLEAGGSGEGTEVDGVLEARY